MTARLHAVEQKTIPTQESLVSFTEESVYPITVYILQAESVPKIADEESASS